MITELEIKNCLGGRPDVTPARLNQFIKYNKQNPWIFEEFKYYAEKMYKKKAIFGAKAIMEIIRWEAMKATGKDGWKNNNSYTSLYARLLAEVSPKFNDFFKFRKLAPEVKNAVCHDGEIYAS